MNKNYDGILAKFNFFSKLLNIFENSINHFNMIYNCKIKLIFRNFSNEQVTLKMCNKIYLNDLALADL